MSDVENVKREARAIICEAAELQARTDLQKYVRTSARTAELMADAALRHVSNDPAAAAWMISTSASALETAKRWQQFHELWPDARRGMATKAASGAGAEARRGKLEAATRDRLAEMQRLIEAGHTVENAALLAAKNGIGKNQGANKALWYRHQQKKS